MKEIVTYIREGFYSNIGGSLSRLIKEIPDKITERSYLHEIGNLRFFFDAVKTRLYKELKELFLRDLQETERLSLQGHWQKNQV